MRRRLNLLCLAVATAWAGLAVALANADDWRGAQVANVFSDNGRFFVRSTPGESWGDTYGFAGASKGAYARGQFYALQPDRSYRLVADVALVNPVAPVDAKVSNVGALITFDNWHNMGYGKVVAIYGRTGQLVASYELKDLYGPERIEGIPRSISSRRWRCGASGWVDPAEQTRVFVMEHGGGYFVFELEGGSFEYRPGASGCEPTLGPGQLSETLPPG